MLGRLEPDAALWAKRGGGRLEGGDGSLGNWTPFAKRAEYEQPWAKVRDSTPPPVESSGLGRSERLGGRQVPLWDLGPRSPGSSTPRGWPFLSLVWLTPLSPESHRAHPGPTWGTPTLGDL